MEPAKSIVLKFGGPTAVAEMLGLHRTRVSAWYRPKDKGGCDGIIPQRHHPKLLSEARERNIELKSDDFLPSEQPAEKAA